MSTKGLGFAAEKVAIAEKADRGHEEIEVPSALNVRERDLFVDQLQGQVRKLEADLGEQRAACIEYRNAILTLGQRLDLMARNQMQMNYRAMALDFATKCRQPGEGADKMVAHAERFFEFLSKAIEIPIAPGPASPYPDDTPATPVSSTTH